MLDGNNGAGGVSPKHGTARWLAVVVVAVGSALLVSVALSVYHFSRETAQDASLVAHTLDVKGRVRGLLQLMSDAETGQRGYLLSQDESYLAPYDAAVGKIGPEFAELARLTADNPRQQIRIAAMKLLIDSKLSELDLTIELAKAGKIDEARRIIDTDHGQAAMESLRAHLRLMEIEETLRLARRRSEFESSKSWLNVLTMGVVAFAALLGLLSLEFARRQMSALNASHEELRDLAGSLERRVRERTEELEIARELAEGEALRAERERGKVELLLRDQNHRIGNNLAMVSSLLRLHLRELGDGPSRDVVEAACDRVQLIATSQRRLRLDDDLESTRLDDLFGSVMSDIGQTMGVDGRITIDSSIPPVVANARDATALAVVLGELMTNAFKYAFPDGGRGTVRVRFETFEPNGACLTVSDDGIGFANGATDAADGLGSKIVKSLAAQFGGEISRRDGARGGTTVEIRLPAFEFARPSADAS